MRSTQKEFLKILSDYQGIIHKVNHIYFRTKADREDNFQEVVYQLWRSFPSLKNREKPASWIYAVAINTSISKARKEKNVEFRDTVPDIVTTDTGERQDRDEEYEALMEALYELPEIDRSVLLLYLEDHSYEEIAQIVGMSSSNVGVKIHRLKSRLQKQLNR